jgi:hypothetical protein
MRAARALDGLDERLHAGARSYVFVSPTRYIPLPEFVIPLAIANAPIFLVVLSDVPSARVFAGALASAAVSALGGALAYVSLMHADTTAYAAKLTQTTVSSLANFFFGREVASSIAPALLEPPGCPDNAIFSAWALLVALIELSLVPLFTSIVVRAIRGEEANTADSDFSEHSRAAVAVALVAHGTAFFPLLYYNAPLAAISSFTMMPFLVVAGAAASRKRGALRTVVRGALWLLSSPAFFLACAMASGYACAVSDTIADAVNLHATYGTSHVPVALLLWLPLHALVCGI